MGNKTHPEFAERLIKLRKDAHLSQRKLANLLGISPSNLFYYESGSRLPGADMALKIAQVFGITVEELLGTENSDVDTEKTKTVEDMDKLFGKRAAASAQDFLDGTSALLAGGTLSAEDQLDFISVMRKILIDAEIRAKQKYTPNRFRTPEWVEHTEAARAEADSIIASIDEEMTIRSSQDQESSFDEGGGPDET